MEQSEDKMKADMWKCLCGGTAEVIIDGIYFCRCKDCGEESPAWAKRHEAIKNWNFLNTRVSEGE